MDLFSTKAVAAKAAITKTIATKTVATKTIATKSMVSNKIAKINANSLNKIAKINATSVNKVAAGSTCGITAGPNGIGGDCIIHPSHNPDVIIKPQVQWRPNHPVDWNVRVDWKF